jgi:hypothetical protein
MPPLARSLSWSADSRRIYAAVADSADVVVVDGLIG